MDDPTSTLLRRYLATLAYRLRKALRGTPDGFSDFQAGHGVRTPNDLLNHMRGRLLFVHGHLRPNDGEEPPRLSWTDEVAALSRVLSALDDDLRSAAPLDEATVHRLLQGPLSDVMTHVGQVAMLRRLAGSPIPAESFYDADVVLGDMAL
ncbi:MAG: hypothetical protein P8Z81_15160 [Deinococcales bacterium]